MSKRTIKGVIRQCFDPLIRLALPVGDFQRLLLEPAGLCEVEQVLDVGCGTGALAVLTKRLHPHICGCHGPVWLLPHGKDGESK